MTKDLVKVMKALSDETRISMVLNLINEGEVACNDFSKNYKLSQPTLSHHYKKLIDANVILARKEGVNQYYSINLTFLKRLGLDLKQIYKANI